MMGFAALYPSYKILSTRPHIEHVTVLRAHVVDPFRGGLRAAAGLLLVDRHQRRLDVGLHLAAVAADEDHRALFDQTPDLVLVLREQVLDIGLRPVAAREGGVEFADAVGGKAL